MWTIYTTFLLHLSSFLVPVQCANNATESVLEYSPMVPSYLSGLSGASTQGYHSGVSPYGYSLGGLTGGYGGYGGRHGYPIDPWRQHRYDYWDSSELYARADYYWLIPVAFIIGIGALLLPVFSLFITAMVTTGTINLTAGRKKRSIGGGDVSQENRGYEKIKSLSRLVEKVQLAMKKFGTQNQLNFH